MDRYQKDVVSLYYYKYIIKINFAINLFIGNLFCILRLYHKKDYYFFNYEIIFN